MRNAGSQTTSVHVESLWGRSRLPSTGRICVLPHGIQVGRKVRKEILVERRERPKLVSLAGMEGM